ncbi:MAG TPA: spore coat associated protein CotJA [Oscillospiraceae bacterium]|nr:spore coat associated protein CotJA [Oscillospiraceae bacterium]HQQ88904.1 spore coat associated protein CotJA [Oscillospiraceae bacterium]HRW57850.1 spore coat associated protein CotJA [Oscillospiraceae bacterium]
MDNMNQTAPIPMPYRRDPMQVLAMAYVPMQVWENLYEPEKAFQRATLFADLDLPYLGRKV